MPHKLKKRRKQRGYRYCGWGQVGQHRKGGMRGGVGKAGGKKHFWLQTVKYNPNRYKSVGFKPPSSLIIPLETVNVGELEDLALRIHGPENVKSGDLELDLRSLGIGKLLGRGRINLPLKLKVSEYTSRALEKLEAAGGEIVEPE